jgi:hypothetical protein
VNGASKEVNEIYAGKTGKSELVYSSKTPPGETVFTSSGTFTVPRGVKSIDIFCVGGGSGGNFTFHGPSTGRSSSFGYVTSCSNCGYVGYGDFSYYDEVSSEYSEWYGGNGGKYYTKNNITVTPGQSIAITVGAGTSYGSSVSVSNAGALCTSSSGFTSAAGESGISERTSTYYSKSTVVNNGSGYLCSNCGKYTGVRTIYGYTLTTNTLYANVDYARKGGYEFDDTSKQLYGCGGGYRVGSSGSGDGGSYNDSNGYSGAVIIKWDEE